MRIPIAILICGTLLIGASAKALTLKEKAQFRKATEDIAKSLSEVKESCGFEIGFEFDTTAFKKWDWESKSLAEFCGGILRQIHYVCSDSEEGKKAVRDHIKKVICVERLAGQPESHKLAGGVFRYSIENDARNSHDSEWLNKNIKTSAGGSLDDAQQWASFNKTWADKMKDMNTTCGTDIKLNVVRKSFAGRDDKWGGMTRCDIPIEALKDCCADEGFRTTKLKKVNTLECKGTKDLDFQFTSLKAGLLSFHVGKDQDLDANVLSDWLNKNVR